MANADQMPAHVERERAVASAKLPPDTRLLEVDGIWGWLYSFRDELGDRYTMFAYHDGSQYQVKVVEPEVEGRFSPHSGHLFGDGRICLSATLTGLATLELAYAKSVLWANGFSIFLRTGKFPFSRNNL
jgi:hypothetical protein